MTSVARITRATISRLEQRDDDSLSVKENTETASAERSEGMKKVGFSCNKCSRVFVRRANLTRHAKNCQKDDNMRIKLEVENDAKISRESTSIGINSSNAMGVSPRERRLTDKYSCMYCDFTAKKKIFLNHHTSEHHENISTMTSELGKKQHQNVNDHDFASRAKIEANGRVYYHCGDCGKNLFSPYTFAWHMKIHSGVRSYTCHLCGKQFRVNQGLSRHLRETHEGIKKFPCNLCGRMFSTKRNVDDHQRIHTNERPFVCTSCGKAFKQRASLFVHNRTHTNVFPFKCTHCNQAFRTRQSLVLHTTKHSGEKAHICDICNRAFRIKHELKRHRLIHFDEKPWQCQHCELSFRQKRYLVNHRKINHAHENK